MVSSSRSWRRKVRPCRSGTWWPGLGSRARERPPQTAPIAPADATRVKASPLARRMATDAGVDLKLIPGSGPGGRVIKRDLEGAAAAAPAVQRTAYGAQRTPFEDIPLTQIRKTIAKRLAA